MIAEAAGIATRARRDPDLDGLRGLAVVTVVTGHLVELALLASAGVAVFFALSGDLITGLLLAERSARAVASLLFDRRRASRLTPAVPVVAATVLWCAVWGVYQRTMGRDLAETLTYVSNWGMVGGSFTVPLRHTWSLAIEEQFYLLWPLVVVLGAGGRRRLTAIAAAGVLVSLAIRLLLSRHSADQVYYRSESNAVLVLLGCLASCANGPRLQRLRVVPLLGTAGLALAVVGYKGLRHLIHSLAAVYGIGLPLVGAGASLTVRPHPRCADLLEPATACWLDRGAASPGCRSGCTRPKAAR